MPSTAERLGAVRERIGRAGGDPARVAIVAITKGRPVAACREALGAGLDMLGENRVREALPKMEAVPEAQWHLVGHLQTNKVRQVAGRFSLIHSVDSLRLAEALAERDGSQRVLLQVNVSREAEKHGFAPDAAVEAARRVAGWLRLEGLMGMGPRSGDPRPCFAELAALARRAREATGAPLPVLSMGMSGDFEAAVQAGSTMLRLGTILFPERGD